ncbi:MAG TPA: ATP-binding protein [Rudaea sp.]|nr:ATP-binding protein [Rudaea sp.]
MRIRADFVTIPRMAGWRERWRKWFRKPASVVPTGVVWNLRIDRDRAAIGRLNDRLDQQLSPSVPEAALRAVQVSLDELLTNVLMHAQHASGPVEFRLSRSTGALDVTMCYFADRFDPTVWKGEVKARTIKAAEIGGHGIPLVRTLMDEFRYEFADGQNILHLKKRC